MPTTFQWKDLTFWKSSEWNRIRGKLTETKSVSPNNRLMFRPLIMTKPADVKVVFVGQEPHPYMQGAPSDGFAYSAPVFFKRDGKATLYPSPFHSRFFSELVTDTGIVPPKHGSLLKWARQGVFLWNFIPTGQPGLKGAHFHWGWDMLSREVLEMIALENPRCVFVPWGLPHFGVNSINQIVLHNTPVYSGPGPDDPGWKDSKPFTRINKTLKTMGVSPVNWNVNY